MLQNNLPRAEQVLGRAYQRNQNNARIRANLALVLGLQGRQTEAEILVKADLPPDQAAAKVAALRELLSKKQQQRAEK
jgi:Flp pilus assembly protein TadD